MSTLRKIFEAIRTSKLNNVCMCGHSVSANLPYCPHCGRNMRISYLRERD